MSRNIQEHFRGGTTSPLVHCHGTSRNISEVGQPHHWYTVTEHPGTFQGKDSLANGTLSRNIQEHFKERTDSPMEHCHGTSRNISRKGQTHQWNTVTEHPGTFQGKDSLANGTLSRNIQEHFRGGTTSPLVHCHGTPRNISRKGQPRQWNTVTEHPGTFQGKDRLTNGTLSRNIQEHFRGGTTSPLEHIQEHFKGRTASPMEHCHGTSRNISEVGQPHHWNTSRNISRVGQPRQWNTVMEHPGTFQGWDNLTTGTHPGIFQG